MKCDACKEREATVHDNAISGGKIVERHLCEACAAKLGVAPSAEAGAAEAVSAMLSGMAGSGKTVASRCPGCGLAFATFKSGGLLGCAECYRAFEAQLAPMLERYHEGGDRHTGKVPRRAGPPSAPPTPTATTPAPPASPPPPARPRVGEREKQIAVLRGQLAAAITSEQYEKAARIRDELKALGDPNLQGPGAGGAGGGGRS